MRKYFTVEEANRTLPLVRRIVDDIVSAHAELTERIAAYRSLPGDAGEEERRRLEGEIEGRREAIEGCIAEIHELGALFKGVEEGLVDYYAMLEERPVFLCWRLGEERIEWWHELEAGYTGRQRLPEHLLVGSGN